MANTILDVNLGNDADYTFTLIPDGSEVDVRIKAVYTGEDKNDPNIKTLRVVYESIDDPDAQDIGAFPIVIPVAANYSDRKAFATIRDRFKAWADCFSVDFSMGLNPEAIKGLTGRVLVEVVDDPQRGRVNQVKRYLVGQR